MAGENVPLAVVGIGCLFPRAAGAGAFWANIKQGVDCVGPVPTSTHWNPEDYFDADPKAPDMTYAARGAFLDAVDFNPLEFGISPVDLEATDTSQLLGLVAARQALNDAGYTPDRKVDKSRISVILGVTGTLELVIPLGARLGHPRWKKALANAGVDQETAKQVVDEIAESYVPWQENSFPGLLGNVVAGRIANKLDLGGTNCVVDAACASSLSAVHLAGLELQTGKCDIAVTGGVDTFNDIFMYMCFSKTPALSKSGNACPFSASGDGTILGEGLGIVVLKRLADAERDGDRIYGIIKSIGSSSDGKGNAVYAPSAEGQMRALRNAYKEANISPATVEMVEGHGTGTKVGDTVEATALAQVYREAGGEGTWCAVGSVKSMIGHTKAAAGAAGLIKAVLSLYNKVIPPTLKVTEPVEPLKPGNSPLYVNTDKRPWLPRAEHPRRAGLSAFGFGGSNFHAVLEEHRPEKNGPDWDGRTQIVALSAKNASELTAALASLPTNHWGEFCTAAAKTRKAFDVQAHARLLLVVREEEDLAARFQAAKQRLEREPNESWSLAEGTHFGTGPAAGTLAVLFPGQGSQSVGMLRDLACTFPEMLNSLTLAERGWKGRARLVDLIYPPSAFTAEARTEQEKALRSTDVAQPALGAVEQGAWEILKRFGLSAQAFAGHSFGELSALWGASVYDAESLHQLARRRGELMAGFAGSDAGTMSAVHAPLGEVERAIQEAKLDVVIANRNSPAQCVISGATKEVARAEEEFLKRRMRTTRLLVAAAFHSSLVAKASDPFRESTEEVRFQRPQTPIFSNTTGRQYPDNPHEMRDLLAAQLARPVEFTQEIETMADRGVRTFVEVGPGTVLTRLSEAILSARTDLNDWACLPIDASNGKKSGLYDLANVLARLAARGHQLDLTQWEAGQQYPASTKKPGLTVAICGANYVKPRPAPAAKPKRQPTPPPAPPMPARSEPPRTPERKQMTTPSQPNLPTPTPQPSPVANLALGVTQHSLQAFQRMQEQTAQLHKQFLENQQAALSILSTLVAQQQALLSAGGMPTILPAPPASIPYAIPVPAIQAAPIAVPTPAPSYAAPAPIAPPAPRPMAPPAPVATAPSPVAAPKAATFVAPKPTPVATAPVATPATTPVIKQAPTKPAKADSGKVLLDVVAEKTGYPVEMLGLDMQLDADLGIDSIKRVEILSALQEKLPEAPAVKPEHLGTLHTLRDIVAFLGAGEAEAKAPVVAAAPVVEPVKPAPAPVASPATSNIRDVLLAVVSEKTGYPAEMLGLNMALDADLGIDSIKRVEIFSALQEKIPDAPAVKPEHLGTMHTLEDIAKFLNGPTPAPENPPTREGHHPFESALTLDSVKVEGERESDPAPAVVEVVEEEVVEAISASPTLPTVKIPRQVLHVVPMPDSPREKLKLAPAAAIWLVTDHSGFSARVSQALVRMGLQPQIIPWSDTPSVYNPRGISGLILIAPEEGAPEDLPLRAFRWVRRAAEGLLETSQQSGAFFATVTRLDGRFGCEGLDPSCDAIAGGLAGLSKTASHEWPSVSCKAFDIDPAAAKQLVPELLDELLTRGPSEIGLNADGVSTLALFEEEIPSLERVASPLPTGSVVVVTGGARGVTTEAILPMVRAIKPRLVLLGRTPLPDKEPDWLTKLQSEGEIKKALAGRLEQPTPRLIGEECQKIVSQREVRKNLERLRQAGATVQYVPVDVQNAVALNAAIENVRVTFGKVTAIVHGAGVLADRKITDLTDEQFQYVYTTKVNGLKNLLAATADDPVAAIVLFSSSTGRFGRTGQVAYAVANEVLNKTAQTLQKSKPRCRTVAINWGPWDGGMVTPALAKVFAQEGVGLIPPTAGGDVLWNELSAPDHAAEVVIIAQPVETEAVASEVEDVVSEKPLHLVFERDISFADHPVLRSHMLNNKGVVPLVLHVEWMGHAALHNNPGLRFHGFDDLRILNAIQVEPNAAAKIQLFTDKATREGDTYVVPVEIRGTKKDRPIVFSRAKIVLANQLPEPPFASSIAEGLGAYGHSPAEAYDRLLFHGPAMQPLERIEGVSKSGIRAIAKAAPLPSQWMTAPIRGAWLSDPLVLDAAYQLLILWSYHTHDQGSLPCYVGQYRQFRRSFPTDGTLIAARITQDNGTLARADIEFVDGDGRLIARMTDAEHVLDASLAEAFRKGRLAGANGSLSHAH